MDLLTKWWHKKPPPPKTHSVKTEFASLQLASSSLVSPLNQLMGSGGDWQKKGWEFYEVVPETRLVVDYRSSALSKVALQIFETTPDGPELVSDSRSEEMLEVIFGGIINHSAALKRYAQHLTLPGETWTFVVPRDGVDEWMIVPPDQVNADSRKIKFTNPLTGVEEAFPIDGLYNFRLWQPHPHKFWEADSPTRGGISSLDKIMHIDASIKTAALSRLVGAGILPMPLEASLPTPTAAQENMSGQDLFRKAVHDNASKAISDPNSAARHTPIFLWMPADAIAALPSKPITFWSEFDDNASDLRDTEIRRYATGQPLPTEMVTGLDKVNHWTGWQLSEEDLKFDIAPLAQTICDALTVRVVQPVMGTSFVVRPNFSDLVSRPDRTPEMLELRKLGLVSLNEVREASGLAQIDGGDDVPVMAVSATPEVVTGGGEPRQLERSIPEQVDRAQDPGMFAQAQMLAHDIVYTAGQWLVTHSGRANRGELQAVDCLERHVVFAADDGVLLEAVGKVRPKYEQIVAPVVFSSVVAYVEHLFATRSRYTVDGLMQWVSRGH